MVIHGHKEAASSSPWRGPCWPARRSCPSIPSTRLSACAVSWIVRAAAVYDTQADVFRPGAAGSSAALAERGLAYVVLHLGSTGDPKGVQIGRESVALLAIGCADGLALGEAPVFMNQAPFSFDLSMYEVFGTLPRAAPAYWNAREQIAAPQQWLARLAGSGVTVWVSTLSFAHQQLANCDFSPQQLRALRTFLFCGEPLPVALARKAAPALPEAAILNNVRSDRGHGGDHRAGRRRCGAGRTRLKWHENVHSLSDR